ncbi:MAG: DeoR/GlpR transcriptional regulator [Lentisphaerae bacterium]|nr:DeoR/GlpR transcriptional regulator [Lentisphaerota bacterium]
MNNTNQSGLAAERRDAIRAMLRERHVARVAELAEGAGVSEATVRRDLAELESRGFIRRVHGGAVSLEDAVREAPFDDKAELAAAEKRRIAEAALQRIKPGDAIFLDGGSTVLALARLLADRDRLTIVTNSLRVAALLAGGGPDMIVVGGEFRRISQTFVGSLTRHAIEPLHVDTAFMGTIGLTAAHGMTTTDPREALTKELIMRNASQVVLLADSSKVGTVSFVAFGSLRDVDVLITDKGIGKTEENRIRKRGVEVVKQ